MTAGTNNSPNLAFLVVVVFVFVLVIYPMIMNDFQSKTT